MRIAIRASFATAVLFFVVSCGQEAPTKPVFSRKVSPYGGTQSPQSVGAVETKDLDALPKSELPITEAGFRAEGERIYSMRCAVCHQPLSISNRKGVDAGKILNDYTKNFPTHRGILWPNDEQAYMIEIALSPPKN